MGKRVVETFFHARSGRWKNRIVGGPDLPNTYLCPADAEREGREFAEFLNCAFRVEPGAAHDTTPDGHPPAGPPPPGPSVEVLAGAANGHIQALAARLERLESSEPDDGEDALRAELKAQVAARLAEVAHQYAGLAHEIAAGIHHTEADDLDRVGEIERATLQRKAASVAEELAAAQREAHARAGHTAE